MTVDERRFIAPGLYRRGLAAGWAAPVETRAGEGAGGWGKEGAGKWKIGVRMHVLSHFHR